MVRADSRIGTPASFLMLIDFASVDWAALSKPTPRCKGQDNAAALPGSMMKLASPRPLLGFLADGDTLRTGCDAERLGARLDEETAWIPPTFCSRSPIICWCSRWPALSAPNSC